MPGFSIVSKLKFLGKTEWFSEKSKHRFTNFNYRTNYWRSMSKNLKVTPLFVDFFQMEDGTKTTSIWFSRRNCCRYSDAPLKHENNCSLTGLRYQLFDIVTGVLQGDTLVSYMFIICLDYVLRTSNKRKRFYAKKRKEADVILQKLLLMQTTQMI